MADDLDKLYDAWWDSPRSNPKPDDLLAGVRVAALRMTHNEDVAQAVCLVVLNKLDTFRRADATAFSRWVRSIIRRTKLDAYRTHSNHTREFDENISSGENDAPCVDTSQLPDAIRTIADRLLEGYSLVEIAEKLNVTSAAIRNKLMRYRRSVLRNAA